MSTKGASNRYGNTIGSQKKKRYTTHINFPWAKGFTKKGLTSHFDSHGKEFGCKTKEEYEAMAIRFANNIDRINCKSVVDYHGTTYKYNKNTNVLVEVTNDGYIVSYRHYGDSFWYEAKKGDIRWIK